MGGIDKEYVEDSFQFLVYGIIQIFRYLLRQEMLEKDRFGRNIIN